MKPTRLCPFCFNPLADNQTLLEEENAKLRELVRDMLRRYYRPFLAEDADRQLARRAEELGVEV